MRTSVAIISSLFDDLRKNCQGFPFKLNNHHGVFNFNILNHIYQAQS